jgi:hypothetical protein
MTLSGSSDTEPKARKSSGAWGEDEMSDVNPNRIAIHVYGGEAMTLQDAANVAEASKVLFDEVTEVIAPGSGLEWEIGAIRRVCDSCGAEAPGTDLPPGWMNAGSDDYCAACSTAAPSLGRAGTRLTGST